MGNHSSSAAFSGVIGQMYVTSPHGVGGVLGNVAAQTYTGAPSSTNASALDNTIIEAETAFKDNSTTYTLIGDELSEAQLDGVLAALRVVCSDNPVLHLAFLEHYGSVMRGLKLMSQSVIEELQKQKKEIYAQEDGEMLINPVALAENFPSAALGTVLIHEFSHSKDKGGGTIGSWQEGQAYGMERVLARRSKAKIRENQIDTYVKPFLEEGGEWAQRYYQSHLLVDFLYMKIDGTKTKGHKYFGSAPQFAHSLTAQQAREFVTEFISKYGNDRDPNLQKLCTWAWDVS